MEDINSLPICAWCQKELNIVVPHGLSHGICKRHAVKTLRDAGESDEEISDFIQKSNGICIDLFTRPDLIQQYQKES